MYNIEERRFIMKLSARSNELELSAQVVEGVHKPLLAVSSVTAQGHQVIFAAQYSHILLKSGEKLPMRVENGVYEIDIWVRSLGSTKPSEQ